MGKNKFTDIIVKPKVMIPAIIILGGWFFGSFIGGMHLFDWDEVNFAECAREMIVTKDYLTVQINYLPFWEKPPLFFWMQVLSMKVFGINEFAARFPNTICGIATLLFLYTISRKLYNNKFAAIWVLVYAGAILPFFYFKSGIIDPWFNLFIFAGLYFCYLYFYNNKVNKRLTISLSGIFIGAGILTKGPVALLIFILVFLVFWIYKRFRIKLRLFDVLLFILTTAITGGIWFILQAINGNFQVILDFILYQLELLTTEDAGHGGFPFYHVVVLLFGVFPASIFAIRSLFAKIGQTSEQTGFKLWMIVLFWVVLILFSIVKTKIVHYSSLCYFPITYLGAITIYNIHTDKWHFKGWIKALLLIIGSISAVALASFPFIDKHKNKIIESGIIKDKFATANLQANGTWTGNEWLIGALLLTGIIGCLWLIKLNKKQSGIAFLFFSSMMVVYFSTLFIVPKVERYTQHAAIEFFQNRQNENCYVEALGYKTYAQYFYTRKMPPENPKSYKAKWLLQGNIDKPAYFVSKITNKDNVVKNFSEVDIMYEKNGFVFYIRLPDKNNNKKQ
jgi:4-amino-4-deoxy-L-arabinose transferase-like glycosyltransferase